MDPLASSGVDPKTAEALRKVVDQAVHKSVENAVEKAVEKALRPLGFAPPQSRLQDTTQNSASKVSFVTILVAVVGLQLGAFYWLNDSVRNDIGSVRAEVGELRTQVNDLRERLIRVEILIEDRLPSTP